jgi:putative phosphoesterase
VRIGVIADTHCPEFMDRLPERVFEVLQGVQLIIHTGDINAQSTLDALARIAPVEAVRGDHDRSLPSLPAVRELTVEGKRIVIVHGQRSRWVEEPQTLLWTLTLGYFLPHRRLPVVLHTRFPNADAIVYGHTHRADISRLDGAVVFNPGAVHQWTPATVRQRLTRSPRWFEWSWLQFARHMRRTTVPTVGILNVDQDGIVPEVIVL